MERRVRGNPHARCGVGEKTEITSKSYLSLYTYTMQIDMMVGVDVVVGSKFGAIVLP